MNNMTKKECTGTFKEIYDALPKREMKAPKSDFVTRMAELTKRSEITVKSWLYGARNPAKEVQSLIEEELGVEAGVLFPKEEKTV